MNATGAKEKILRARFAFLCAVVLVACGERPTPAPVKPAVPSVSASASIAPAADGPPRSPLVDDLVMREEGCKADKRASITRAEAHADVLAVAHVVRRGWAGLETMTKTGVDFDRIFGELDSWIEKESEPISTNAF